jgi:CheY-like chemotaxis protein
LPRKMSGTPPPEVLNRTAEYATSGSVPKPLVLVIDDDWEICEAVEEVLKAEGFEIIYLGDGARAFELLRSTQRLPAVIVLDLMMPKVDGWSFFNRVRAEPRLGNIPIVVLTAVGPHWGYPLAQVLRKPINRHELVSAVRNAVQGTGDGLSIVG